jgi:hypothetical protein
MTALAMVGASVVAFYWGRIETAPRATAEPPRAVADEAEVSSTSDYSQRAVAYIYGSIPISREELGEYLIARQGAEKLELLVNKRIIEHACKQRGIEVTQGEIEAALNEDLKSLHVNLRDFEDKILKQYHKSLFEWKEDVIKPKLLMTKLCRDRVKATEKDFEDAFQAHHGEKIECRMILFPTSELQRVRNMYGKLRDSEEEFDRAARQQATPSLASSGGKIRPISRNSTGNPELERAAFSLRPGEVSSVIETPQGVVLLKCDRRIPPDSSKRLADERANLEKEIIEKKIQAEMPKVFEELRREANPQIFLRRYTKMEDVLRGAEELLKQIPAGKSPPTGN